jgi:peptidoglycan/LPS O-acetylase OafA/YrhL
VAADPTVRAEVGGDAAASVAQVANWWFLASGQSYADLFTGPSPLLHYWSLAVEEQFYLVFPVLAWVLLGTRRWTRDRFALVLGGVALVTALTPVVLPLSADAVYYSTWTRAPELLAGALLAWLLQRPGVATRLADGGRAARVVAALGTAGLALTLAAWSSLDRGEAWLHRGGFGLYAVATCAVLGAALLPGGPVARVLGTAPLRRLGAVSYGVYVFHWPIFLWLDEARTGLGGVALLVVRLVPTLALAEASFRWLEQPIRRGSRPAGIRPGRALLPAAALTVAVALGVAATAPPPAVDFAAAEELARAEAAVGARPPDRPAGPAAPEAPAGALDPALVAEAPPEPRVAFFGDSTALMVGYGLGMHLRDLERDGVDPGLTTTSGIARLGCGIARGGERRNAQGGVDRVTSYCDGWPVTWAEKVRVFAPTLAVVQVGPWEVADRRMPGDDRWRGPGDPVYDEWLHGELLVATDVLAADGAGVVWLTTPAAGDRAASGGLGAPGVRDRARWDRFNELVRRLGQDRPEVVRVIDVAAWAEDDPRDGELRPDGIHFSEAGAVVLADELLLDALVAAGDELWSAGRERRLALARARAERPPVSPPAPGEALRVVVWGDLSAAALGEALGATTGARSPVEVATVAEAGCGVTQPIERRVDGRVEAVPACATRDRVDEAVERLDPHVVVVAPGAFEQAELRITDEPGVFTRADEAPFDDWVRAGYGAAADHLATDGTAVVFVVPSSNATLERLVGDLAASPSRRGHVGVLDPAGRQDEPGALAAWLAPALRAELDRLAG